MKQIYGVGNECKLWERKLILPQGSVRRAPTMAAMFGMNVFVDDTLPDNEIEIEQGGRRYRFTLAIEGE